jgi:hypothetical protein
MKKQIIVAYCEEHTITVAGPGEIRKISDAIHRTLEN